MSHPESDLPTSLLREQIGKVEDSTRFMLALRDAVETDWIEHSKDSIQARVKYRPDPNSQNKMPAEIIAQTIIDEAQHVTNIGRESIVDGVTRNGALTLDFASGIRYLVDPLIEPTDETRELLSQDPSGMKVILGRSDQVLLGDNSLDLPIESYQSRSAFRLGVLTGVGLHLRAITTVKSLLAESA